MTYGSGGLCIDKQVIDMKKDAILSSSGGNLVTERSRQYDRETLCSRNKSDSIKVLDSGREKQNCSNLFSLFF